MTVSLCRTVFLGLCIDASICLTVYETLVSPGWINYTISCQVTPYDADPPDPLHTRIQVLNHSTWYPVCPGKNIINRGYGNYNLDHCVKYDNSLTPPTVTCYHFLGNTWVNISCALWVPMKTPDITWTYTPSRGYIIHKWTVSIVLTYSLYYLCIGRKQ